MTDLFAVESPQGDTSSLAYVGSSLLRALEANGHAPIAIPTRGFDPSTTPAAVLRAYARQRPPSRPSLHRRPLSPLRSPLSWRRHPSPQPRCADLLGLGSHASDVRTPSRDL